MCSTSGASCCGRLVLLALNLLNETCNWLCSWTNETTESNVNKKCSAILAELESIKTTNSYLKQQVPRLMSEVKNLHRMIDDMIQCIEHGGDSCSTR